MPQIKFNIQTTRYFCLGQRKTFKPPDTNNILIKSIYLRRIWSHLDGGNMKQTKYVYSCQTVKCDRQRKRKSISLGIFFITSPQKQIISILLIGFSESSKSKIKIKKCFQ